MKEKTDRMLAESPQEQLVLEAKAETVPVTVEAKGNRGTCARPDRKRLAKYGPGS